MEPELATLRDMCLEYFLAASKDKVYTRSPPLALRLPHGDFLIVVKPTTLHFDKTVTVDSRGIIIEIHCQLDDCKSAKWMTLIVSEEVRKIQWKVNDSLNRDALTALSETAKEFVDDPQAVIRRNKDHCGCCGKGLSDEVSRARGIGPECMNKVKVLLQYLLAT